MRRSLLVVVVALAGVVATVAPSHAAINRPVAVWQMNEPAGSRTMLDSSGNGINGVIGTDVLAGTALTGGGTGYRFTFIRPNQPPANPQRLVQVPHNARLNPGTGDFALEVRLRTTHSFGNVIQKGSPAPPAATSSCSSRTGRSPACSAARREAARRPPARPGSTTGSGTRSAASAPPPAWS